LLAADAQKGWAVDDLYIVGLFAVFFALQTQNIELHMRILFRNLLFYIITHGITAPSRHGKGRENSRPNRILSNSTKLTFV